MPSSVQNRKTIRQALATLLTAELVGAGKPVQALYRYKASDFNGQSPVVVVTSAPTNRAKQAQTTRVASFVDMDIYTFVSYAEAGWTEEQSEDNLDDLEKEISDVLMDNESTDSWAYIAFKGDSELDFIIIGGKEYRVEIIHVRARLFSD